MNITTDEESVSVPDKILRQIKLLLDRKERPASMVDEEQVTAMLNKLLLKYNVSLSEVENYNIEEKNPVEALRGDFNDYQNYHEGDFSSYLLNVVSKHNLCKLIRVEKRKGKDCGKFCLVGRKNNCEIVLYMFQSILNNLKVLANDAWAENRKFTNNSKYVYLRAFYDGAVAAISSRLKKEEATNDNQTMALIRTNDIVVQDKVKELFGGTKPSKGRGYSGGGFGAGYQVGTKLPLNKGVGSTGSKIGLLRH